MKHLKQKQGKLSINKFKISRINRPQLIVGGRAIDGDDDERYSTTIPTVSKPHRRGPH